MSTLGELVKEARERRVAFKNRKGRPLIDISLLLALILVVAAPQLLVVVLIGMALELLEVEYDGRPLGWDGLG